LPSHSPELNPDEYFNGDFKAGVHSVVPSRSKGQLKKQGDFSSSPASKETQQSQKIL
jgi:hypothetical protein